MGALAGWLWGFEIRSHHMSLAGLHLRDPPASASPKVCITTLSLEPWCFEETVEMTISVHMMAIRRWLKRSTVLSFRLLRIPNTFSSGGSISFSAYVSSVDRVPSMKP